MRKRIIIAIVVFIVIVIIAVVAFLFWRAMEPKPASPRAPISVTTTVAKKSAWPSEIKVIGHISALHGIMLKSDYAGYLTKVYVKSGQRVKAGQPLYQVNPRGLAKQLDAAAAQMARLKFDYEEAQKLYADNVVSENRLVAARNDYKAAVADYNKVDKVLALTLVTAPFDGTVGLRILHLGDYVPEGGNLVSMQMHNKYYVEFQLPSNFVNILKVGQVVTFTSKALPSKTFNAKIYAVNNRIDPSTDLLGARAMINDPTEQVMTGLVVKVLVKYNLAQKAIVIPQDSLVFTLTGPTVFIVNHNRVKQMPVTSGDLRNGMVAILKGVKVGDVIVTSGGFKLKQGSVVREESSP
ncbi:MAG: efflux RND transporter periplasmic adaptor subunit [Coxiellaceae bacterium]|nr:efflux RND transporter periplasmic adaptor subunit [Coxiellaceae bacterium]